MEEHYSSTTGKVEKLIFRVPGAKALRLTLKLIPQANTPFSSSIFMMYGFAALIILGAILLILPVSSKTGDFTSPVNAIFTAASAVCVTGLTVVETGAYWSVFGQGVLLALFQIGGLGFIAGATLLLLAINRRFGLRERLFLTETMGTDQIGGSFGVVIRIVIFSLVIESIGAAAFYLYWASSGDLQSPLWTALFHSVSSFNNCGMDIFSNSHSMSSFQGDATVLLLTAFLIICGSIGYVVIMDFTRNRSFGKLSLDSKIVLVTTFALIVLGTVFYLVAEYSQPATLGPLAFFQKLLVAFFQSVSLRTAGFTAFDAGGLLQICLLFTMVLMCIGGSSGSVAGGVKVNTLGVLAITVLSLLKGRDNICAFGKQLGQQTIYRALTLTVMYLIAAGIIVTALSITEVFPLNSLLFETLSALGTTGSSTGITPDLSSAGKIILVIAMFTGRLAPLSFMAYLAHRRQVIDMEYPHENIRLG